MSICDHCDDDDSDSYHPAQQDVSKSLRKNENSIKCRSSKVLPSIKQKQLDFRQLGDFSGAIMSHTPCGPDEDGGTKQNCWETRCTKKFPRKEIDETDATIEGYPNYRRRTLLNEHTDYEMPFRIKRQGTNKWIIKNKWLPGISSFLLKNQLIF